MTIENLRFSHINGKKWLIQIANHYIIDPIYFGDFRAVALRDLLKRPFRVSQKFSNFLRRVRPIPGLNFCRHQISNSKIRCGTKKKLD